MDEDATWYGNLIQCGPGHIVLGGSQLPTKGAQQPPPVFGPCLLWPRSPISAAAELFTVMLLMGIQGCQTVGPSIDRSRILMYSPCLPLFPSLFISSPALPIPSLSSPPSLLEVGPVIAAWKSGERINSPAGPGGARPPNAFWCIVGIN